MKRFWIMLLAVAMALVIALPAGAGKPDKPPKPSTSAPVAVYLDAGPIWVHEAGDDIWYDVTVQNKTRDEVTATINWTSNGEQGEQPVEITDPRGVESFPRLFSYTVTAADIDAGIAIVGTVTVTYDGGEVIAETSTVVDPIDACEFDKKLIGGEVCIWTLESGTTGEWTVSVMPDPVPTRPTNLMVSVRDGVPGNWCTVPDEDGVVEPDTGVVSDRWLPGDGAFELRVYLPGSDDLAFKDLDDGQCYTGGAGVCFEDDCYFAVGRADSFYLYTSFDGIATVTPND